MQMYNSRDLEDEKVENESEEEMNVIEEIQIEQPFNQEESKVLNELGQKLTRAIAKNVLDERDATFAKASSTFQAIIKKKVNHMALYDDIIKSAKELNFLALNVAKIYYNNEERIKGPPTTEAWVMAVVETLTQLLITLPSLEDCDQISRQVREKMTSRLNTFLSEKKKAETKENREKKN